MAKIMHPALLEGPQVFFLRYKSATNRKRFASLIQDMFSGLLLFFFGLAFGCFGLLAGAATKQRCPLMCCQKRGSVSCFKTVSFFGGMIV